MSQRAWTFADRTAAKTLHFLQVLLRDYHPRDFTVELWDGNRWEPEPDQFRRFTWRINRPDALRTAFESDGQVALAEGYIYDDFDIEGDIEAIFPLADYLLNRKWSTQEKLRLTGMLLGLPAGRRSRTARPGMQLRGRTHSKERDRQAVGYHYNLSNDFYALWLDRNLVYSCAYFLTADDDLDTAQVQKLDYICRKLRLHPGERLLDIGCGWGGLILHAAREYGVHALGITLSQPQFELAAERIRQASLADRCEVRLMDYRDLNESEAWDKLVSVGMVEHVGGANLPEYFRRAFGLLRPGGVFLNHGIARAGSRPAPSSPTFTDVYVFPDGELVPLATTLRAAEEAGFETRDVENLREHYALTLRHWLRGLETHAEEAHRVADEVSYRIWRLYLAGSAYYFQTGRLDVYQTLLVKNDRGRSGLPLTRTDWYVVGQSAGPRFRG
jgi:cyclopropane-fatty-acyl-phospholipid synthase